MKNFIKLRSLLDRIPSELYNESSEAEIMEALMDGLDQIPKVLTYEPRIELFEIIDGKIQLPKYIKEINSVRWQSSNPSSECITELETVCGCEVEPSDLNPDICRLPITYQMWLDSRCYRENFTLLKYKGSHSSLISNNCECYKSTCSESFVVTPQKMMYLTINSGWVCIEYDTPVCDEDNEILITDSSKLNEYLISYVITRHWENRQFTKESQSANFFDKYSQRTALLLRQAKGSLDLRQVDINTISNLDGQFKKLIKLPEIMFYVR